MKNEITFTKKYDTGWQISEEILEALRVGAISSWARDYLVRQITKMQIDSIQLVNNPTDPNAYFDEHRDRLMQEVEEDNG